MTEGRKGEERISLREERRGKEVYHKGDTCNGGMKRERKK